MNASNPGPDPESRPIVDEREGAAGRPPEWGGRPDRLVALSLAVGLAAGLVAWPAGELAAGAFPARRVTLTNKQGLTATAPTLRTLAAADVKDMALGAGLFGALLGTALGLAGGLARRSVADARRAALVGLLAGAGAGAAAALRLGSYYDRHFGRISPEDLAWPLLIHVGMWSPIGAAAGLAFGFGLGGRGRAARALVGGLLGAALGAVVYEMIGATAFPLARTYQPTAATWLPRLLARLLVAGLAAVGAAWAVVEPRRIGSNA